MHDHGGRATPARPPRRRWRPPLAALVAMLALTLAVTACAGGGKSNGVASLNGSKRPTATTSGSGTTDPKEAALAFARCMRQHGIDMPDPKFDANGGMSFTVNGRAGKSGGPDDPKFKAAQQACNKYLPNGGQPTKPNPQEQQQMLQFARCMRQHGIDVPDPGASGGIDIGPNMGVHLDSPEFKAAQQACEHYLPNAGKGGMFTQSGGGK